MLSLVGFDLPDESQEGEEDTSCDKASAEAPAWTDRGVVPFASILAKHKVGFSNCQILLKDEFY